MKKKIITTAFLTTALAFPIGAWAAYGGGSSTSGSSSSSSSSEADRPHTSTSGMSSAMSSDVQRISSSELDQKFTAKDLLNREIYDQEGNRVGSIVDFALASDFPQELASQLSQPDKNRGSSRTASRSDQSESTSTSAKESWTGSTAMTESEPSVFVRVGGVLGMGGDMVRIPVSQLQFDSSARHLTVAMSQSQLSAIAKGEPANAEESPTPAKERWNDSGTSSGSESDMDTNRSSGSSSGGGGYQTP